MSSEKKLLNLYRKSEIVVSIFIIFLSASFAFFMPHLIAKGGMVQAQDFIRLSPIFFPRLSFAALSILGILYLIQIFKSKSTEKEEETFPKEILLNVSIVFIFVTIYTFLLPYLGYGIASMVMIFLLSYHLGNRVWWQLFLLSFFIPLTIRIIFERVLFIYLPRSHYEILGTWEDEIVKFFINLFLIF